MGDQRTFVIVGAGLAGARAAQTLRQEGFAGRVMLVGAEPVRPYDRVPLSKQYLRGEPGGHTLFLHDEAYYAAHDIELLLSTTVAGVDSAARTIELAGGTSIGFDALLLATGAEVRRLSVPGSRLSGVKYLRSISDADELRAAMDAAGRVVVIGAGWIGCEVAASARELGLEVALVDVADLPLAGSLEPRLAGFYRDLHAAHGVEFHLGAGVAEFRGAAAVEEVVLADGSVLPADLVVAGVGVRPRTALAEAAGVVVDNGVVTDQGLATSVPGIFAAGDLANAWHPSLGRRLRLEHWSSALNQGPVAARAMLGQPVVYDQIPFFFSDQYDVWMEYTGDPTGADQVVFRGDPVDGAFIAFWLRKNRLLAGMNVNIRDVAETIGALIADGHSLDSATLSDPDVELRSLVLTDRSAPG